jgi:hypothetical protein
MAFLNQSIISPNITATNLTGTTLFSGSTNLASVRIPQNRRLLSNLRTAITQSAGSGTSSETIATTFTYTAGTLSSGDSIEINTEWLVTSNNALTKSVNIRLGTAGTTSDTAISQYTTTSNTTVYDLNYTRLVFMSNSSFDVVPNGGFTTSVVLVTASTVNLSGLTTYITITGTRPTVSADTITIYNCDIFHNKISN